MKATSLDQSYISLLDNCTNFYDAYFADKENAAGERNYELYMVMCSTSAVAVCDKYHYNTKKIFDLIDQYSSHPEDAKDIINDWIDTTEDDEDLVDDFIQSRSY